MNREELEGMEISPATIALFIFLLNKVDKYIKLQARNTIAENASRDRACLGYRTQASAGSCKFCQEIERSGISKDRRPTPLHAGCNCPTVPVFRFESNPINLKVSGGYDSNEKWLSKYDPEIAVVKVDGKTICRKVGSPNESEFPNELPNGYRYSNAELVHTHTTPTSGTFSDVDVITTTKTYCKKHTVIHMLTGKKFTLERTKDATWKSGKRFRGDYYKFYNETRDQAEYEYWEKYLKASEEPLTDAHRREIHKNLQPVFDRWLHENAGKYGYRYSS